jgi:hypothetical protein
LNQFYKDRKWLTLDETVDFISERTSEPVNKTNVLQLGLDEKLTLSINFVNPVPVILGENLSHQATGLRVNHAPEYLMSRFEGDVEKIADYLEDNNETNEQEMVLNGIDIGHEQAIKLHDNQAYEIVGVFDLLMVGDGCIQINKIFHQLLRTGVQVKNTNLTGIFVSSVDNQILQIQKTGSFNNTDFLFPSYDIPAEDCCLAIRPAAIEEYLISLNITVEPKQNLINYAGKRLNDLRDFINLLVKAAAAKNLPIDVMALPATKKQLLNELNSRNKGTAHWGVNIDSFNNTWKLKERRTICDIKAPRTKEGEKFLKKILG